MALKADVVNGTLDSNSGTTGRFRWLLESHCVTAATTPSLPYIAVADDMMLGRIVARNHPKRGNLYRG